VVLGGQIDLYHQKKEQAVVIRSVTTGEMIGEFVLVVRTKPPANAIVARKCDVLRISRSILR